MNIKPFALKLTKTITHNNSSDNSPGITRFTLKGKFRYNGKSGKTTVPIQPIDLSKVVIAKTIPKAQALQPGQELVLTRSQLIPDFLDFWKKNILTKLRR